ncbi:amidase family protein [Arthrobacter sp. S2(2024)]|uniref:amidase family protein n=1 Tax=Arthrobacter sp. S2(2024) TaxID=3111911 RepID=UPI002FCB3489
MKTTTGLEQLSAIEQAALVRAGDVSVVELVCAHLDRIERYDPRVNAIVTLDADSALRAAVEADRVPAEQRGALHGLPIAIKAADTANMRTTYGHPSIANNIPPKTPCTSNGLGMPGPS